MTPQLYLGNLNYSSWSIRALLVARNAGYACEEIVLPLGVDGTKEAILKATGQHRVPALVLADLVIHDSLAIIEWIAENSPSGSVWPIDAKARARARAICAEMHGGFVELRTHLGVNIRARNLSHPGHESLRNEIERIIEIWTETRENYGIEGPYLFGPWSAADAVYAPVATRFRTYGVEISGTAGAYMDAVLQHRLIKTLESEAAAEPWSIDTSQFAPAKAN